MGVSARPLGEQGPQHPQHAGSVAADGLGGTPQARAHESPVHDSEGQLGHRGITGALCTAGGGPEAPHSHPTAGPTRRQFAPGEPLSLGLQQMNQTESGVPPAPRTCRQQPGWAGRDLANSAPWWPLSPLLPQKANPGPACRWTLGDGNFCWWSDLQGPRGLVAQLCVCASTPSLAGPVAHSHGAVSLCVPAAEGPEGYAARPRPVGLVRASWRR